MANRKISTNFVKVTNNSVEIPAYLAMPLGEGPFPGVVVLQEIFGVNSHIRDVTERFAKEGYIAIAPALYQRQAPGFETGYTAEDIKIGRQYKEQTKASELLSDIQAAINYLKSETPLQDDTVGCIGFCFGGHVAYLAATLPEIKATASFYGAGITTMTPGGGEPTVSRTSEISGTIYGFFGKEDVSIPQAQVDEIEATLEKHQIKHHIFSYDGAEHGFFCDQRASYNQTAATDAWEKVKQLFHKELSPVS
ncbi:dienelactone hydrolase family protein [Lyngbya aestuarii]|uniref:dienelactone hydrolase family protein n=1 Tax=Lyngbya aestuarii TaxID=118322 RepID=UPI00403D9AC9